MPDDWRTPLRSTVDGNNRPPKHPLKLKFEENSKKRYNINNELTAQDCINEELTEFENEAVTRIREAALEGDQQREFLDGLGYLLVAAQSASSSKPFPSTAPELWKSRDKSKDERPHEFILRVYGSWYDDKVLSKADIRRLDPTLFHALFEQQRDEMNPPPEGFYLPTKKELNDRKLAKVLESGELPTTRIEYGRVEGMAQRRGISLRGLSNKE